MPAHPRATGRNASQRDALLALARTFAQSRQGGVLADALDAVLSGLGAARGAVYTLGGERLGLVADRGLPSELRRGVDHLPLTDPVWFVAQRAAKTRKPAYEADLAAALAGRVPPRLVAMSGWAAAAAVPIVSGRDVIGVVCAADPDRRPSTPTASRSSRPRRT